MIMTFIKGLTSKWAILISVLVGVLMQILASPLVISHAWAISLLMKKLILTSLPFIMFGVVASALIKIGKNGIKVISILIVLSFIINFVCFFSMYPLARFTSIFDVNTSGVQSTEMMLYGPAWECNIPMIIKNDVGILCGVLFWIASRLLFLEKSFAIGEKISSIAFYVLQNVLGPIIPFFIAGFICDLNFNDFVLPIFSSNLSIILITISIPTFFIYMSLVFCNGFKGAFNNLVNMFPATMIAFTTMSSSLALPATLNAMKKNRVSDNIILFMPGICHILTLADCFVLAILIFITLSIFKIALLSFYQYLVICALFSLYKFSNCCIPGGTVMCVMPVIVSHCGFNEEMCILIASMSLVLDSFTTAGNAMGHGACGIIFDKLFKKILPSYVKN